MFNRRMLLAAVAAAAVLSGAPVSAQDKSIVVSSTTSTQDSGLFGYILPLFKQKTGIEVKVIAQGTGQALDTGRRGDADAERVDTGDDVAVARQGVPAHRVGAAEDRLGGDDAAAVHGDVDGVGHQARVEPHREPAGDLPPVGGGGQQDRRRRRHGRGPDTSRKPPGARALSPRRSG